jgi:hypothetical protein
MTSGRTVEHNREKLPNDEEDRKRAEQERKSIQAEIEKRKSFMSQGPGKGQTVERYIFANCRYLTETTTMIEDQFGDREVFGLGRDVLMDAEKERQHAERLYSICTWASYALYFVGWSLGLIGRIYGADEGAGHELDLN